MSLIPIINPFISFPTGGFDSDFLDGVLSSTCCDLDATLVASYSGSGQTWANLIVTPADSASQTDYDFHLGADGSASTDDPTHTGTPGDAGAYFALDGGDFFTSKISANTIFNEWHKTSGVSSGPTWVAMAFQLASLAPANAFFGNTTGSTHGLRMIHNTSTAVRFFQRGSTSFNEEIMAGGTFTATTDYLMIVTFDSSSTGSEKIWVNTTTGANWTTAYSPIATTTNPSVELTIAALPASGLIFNNGSRLYSFACGNEILNDAKAALIFAHLETRHGRDYTP